MSQAPEKTPNQQLDDAISTGNPEAVKRALAAGADVINGNASEGLPTPLLRAIDCVSVEIVDILIQALLGKLSTFDASHALNVLDSALFTNNSKFTLRQRAAANDADGMLATVWSYFRGKKDINEPFAEDKRLVHAAAHIPANLTYLLKEGAYLNVTDDKGTTPLMEMFYFYSSRANVFEDFINVDVRKKLLEVYEEHGANFHAVDYKGHNAIHYVLNTPTTAGTGKISSSQIVCLNYALAKGIDAHVRGKDGKTALDHLMRTPNLASSELRSVLHTLASHGYNITALMRQYGSSLPSSLLKNIDLKTSENHICNRLTGLDSLKRLWNADESPSELLLKACGFESLSLVFEHGSLNGKPDAAFALYQKMEEKLPRQCQDHLRNGFDKPFLRDVVQPPKPDAVLSVLKRNKPDAEKGLGR